ncbi:hypothetical protein B296_00007849, partial [Ensete ventricosum]
GRKPSMEEEEESHGSMFEGGVEVRVLVVDDSPVDRRVVEGLLKRSGSMFQDLQSMIPQTSYFHAVIAVDSGKRAMEVLGLTEGKEAEQPTVYDPKIDIILTDYCMPEMTGYDLLKAVK